MQTKGALVCFLAAMACGGVVVGIAVVSSRRGALPASQPLDPPQKKELTDLNKRGRALFLAGRYAEAAGIYDQGWRQAKKQGDTGFVVRFMNDLGACRVAMFRYRDGMNIYLQARELAEKTRNWEWAANLASNISALYVELREIPAAVQAAEAALTYLKDPRLDITRARILINLARLRARTGDMKAAIPLFREAVDQADLRGDPSTMALAWNHLGNELLLKGDLTGAEEALVEAFRIRKLTRDKALPLSLRLLGVLRLAQGDLDSASRLLDEAVSLAGRSPSLVPIWQLHHDRGRVRMAQGRLPEALADFSVALDSARRWRLEVLPADSVRVSSEVGLQEIYSSFIEAGNRLYFQTGRRALAYQTFEAAEENRAASLRALLAAPEDWREKLPPEHGEALAQLRAAETASLRGDTPATRAKIQQLRHQLTELEARAGLDSSSAREAAGSGRPEELFEQARRALGANEAFLSFHLGEAGSYLWAVTRDDFELCRLPPRSQIRDRVGRFIRAVRGGSPEAESAGQSLYTDLFGGLKPGARDKGHWLLALDDVLFELPLAALVTGSQPETGNRPGRPVFLIERHALEITPSAHLLARAAGNRAAGRRPLGPFIGLGDPIYNRADPRWKERVGGSPAVSGKPAFELARLAGSSREIRACARAWSPASVPPVLLEGPEASREALHRILGQRPSVLHLATHVVERDRRGLIALSLLPSGEAQLLSPLEIASWRLDRGLVVLSGCSSGQGEALPGAGLMGLTRAWLAAGASAVVASRWPTPDDSGELFLSFYRHLRASTEAEAAPRPAVALQRAQLEMLNSATWRSLPGYWAAYFTIG